MDGSTKKNGEEVISLVVHYNHNSVIYENVLNIRTVQDLSAKWLLDFILATFKKYEVGKGWQFPRPTMVNLWCLVNLMVFMQFSVHDRPVI